MKLTWQTVILASVFGVLVVGACLYLITIDKAPASVLLVPLTLVLTGAASGAVFYMRGLFKMPSLEGADGSEYKIVRTGPPPAPIDDFPSFEHDVSIPPFDTSIRVEREAHDVKPK